MVMTKSRRVSRTKAAAGFTPDLEDLVGEKAIEQQLEDTSRLIDHMKLERGPVHEIMAAEAWGGLAALSFKCKVLMEAAFARIAALETALSKADKALKTKSLASRFSLDDLEVEQIDDRRVRLVMKRGPDEASVELRFPVMIDRGIWSDRAHYERGDTVSRQGALWTAQQDSPGVPGAPDSGWRLSVKPPPAGKRVNL